MGAVLLLAVQRVVRRPQPVSVTEKTGFALAARAQAQHDPPAARGAGPHSVGEQMEADAGEIPAVRLDDQLVQAAAVQTETDIQLLLQLILFGAEGADKGAQLYRFPPGRFGLLGRSAAGRVRLFRFRSSRVAATAMSLRDCRISSASGRSSSSARWDRYRWLRAIMSSERWHSLSKAYTGKFFSRSSRRVSGSALSCPS